MRSTPSFNFSADILAVRLGGSEAQALEKHKTHECNIKIQNPKKLNKEYSLHTLKKMLLWEQYI